MFIVEPCSKKNRLRSRTPQRSRSSGGECLFCHEPITEQDKWVCFVCSVQAHKHCESQWRHAAAANRGCPQCKTTKMDVVREQTLRPAVKGIVCFICREVVREGHECDMCLGGRDFCQAYWHPQCMLPQWCPWERERYKPAAHKCPACGLSKWAALNERRR